MPLCDALRDLVAFAQFKHVKNTYRGVSILVNLQVSACNFTKINIRPWVFFTFFKLYKCYQIVQSATLFPQILGYFVLSDLLSQQISRLFQSPMMALLSGQHVVIPSFDLFLLLIFVLYRLYS